MAENERFNLETEEFFESFPDVDLDSVKDSVWERVKKGENLTAVYKESRKAEADAARYNEKNRMASTGFIGSPSRQSGVYNERDVRAMTPKQVRADYDNIIKSMGSKGFFR